ncbi:MAG: pseudouridine synthase [Candidatus Nanopelagicales bacterium]|nr:pseudouridine synthase [Candidatus Nanopelagicales bacterium]MDZ4249985.1 pseudouridine synthase [Candidatus Nanopelagicales bacterium]
MTESGQGERLQKVLARAGLGSRRKCEALISQGRVFVNGQVVAVQGFRVPPGTTDVRVDGKPIPTSDNVIVLALNKPKGILSTMADDGGRPCVGDLVADREERLFHVGRLDADTTGLLLLTNDGELAHRLQHPSHGVSKTYRATVRGPVPASVRRSLTRGVELEDGPAVADSFQIVAQHGQQSIVEIRLHEGRNRIVRRMMAAVGHPVIELVRVSVGPVTLGGLRPGAFRKLTAAQVASLYAAADES